MNNMNKKLLILSLLIFIYSSSTCFALEEKHMLSNYLIYKTTISRINGQPLIDAKTIRCPRCNKEIPTPEHGIQTSCRFCSLKMIAYGNALYLEIE